MNSTIQRVSVTNAGLTLNPASAVQPSITYVSIDANLVLAANVSFDNSDYPPDGTSFVYILNGGNGSVDLNGFTFKINGVDITQNQLQAPLLFYNTSTGGDWDTPIIIQSFDASAPSPAIDGSFLVDASVTLAKLAALARGSIIAGDATSRPAALNAKGSGKILIGDGTDVNSVAVTGDIGITSGGVTSIAAGVIVNADVNATAAIALSKLAALTASKVCVTDGSGVITTANQLSAALGGTGADNSAATGFQTWSAGTQSVGAIYEVINLQISFEAAGGTAPSVGDFKVKMPYAGTVVEIYAYATKAIAGTDNATIVPKNNAGTTMTSGTVTFTAADPRGTAYTTTPSANNTFVAGDILTFTSAKVTAGGYALLSVSVTRTS